MRISNYPTDTLTGDELILATDVNTSTQEYKTVNFSVDTLKTFLVGTDDTNEFTNITLGGSLKFEGATANAYETTLGVVDPTADITINLPNVAGTLPVLAAASTTAITSTPEELNILDGVTATATEINTLDGITSTVTELNTLDGVNSGLTAAELNVLDGITASTTELNILDGVTATAAELNILDGVTSTAAELNILDGVTSTAAELNVLDGITSTTAALNKLDGYNGSTSELNILNGATLTTSELNTLDGFTGVVADLNYAKDLRATGVTTSEFDYLDLTSLGVVEVEKVVSADANGDVTFPTDKAIITQGNLLIKGSGETLAKFVDDGSVELYHNDIKKLETIAGGVKSSGIIQMGHGAAAGAIDLASATSIQVNDSAGTISVTLDGALVGNALSPEITVTNNNGATNGGAVVSMSVGNDHPVSVFAYKVDATGFKFKFRNEGSTLADDTVVVINFNVIWRNT